MVIRLLLFQFRGFVVVPSLITHRSNGRRFKNDKLRHSVVITITVFVSRYFFRKLFGNLTVFIVTRG